MGASIPDTPTPRGVLHKQARNIQEGAELV